MTFTDHTAIPEKEGPTMDRCSLFRRLVDDRGAVLVEAAIAIPLLLFVILGSLEFGIAWETKSSTTNGMRSGLLRAATLADDDVTDLRILQSIIGEVGGDDAENISWVVIFRVDPGDDIDMVADACADAIDFGGTVPNCVGYSNMTILDVANTTDANDFHMMNFDQGGGLQADGTYDCRTGVLDSSYCAGSRTINGDVQIGIAFEYEHDWLTGILPFDGPTFREIQTTSTFAEDGIVITGTNLAVGPGNTAIDEDYGGPGNTLAPTTLSLAVAGNNATATVQEQIYSVPIGLDTEVCVELDLILMGDWDPLGDTREDWIDVSIAETGEMTRIDFDHGGTGPHIEDDIPTLCFDVTGESGPVTLQIQSRATATGETFEIDRVQVNTLP